MKPSENKMTYKSIQFKLLAIAILAALLGLPSISGCGSGDDNDSGDASSRNGLPKLDFHRPDDLASAHKRMSEIHEILTGDQEIPAPRKIKVVEVIHGEGASAHSHYYRVTKSEAGDGETPKFSDHEHEGEKSEQKQHEIEIDIFTEVYDIARWLPSIAADGDTAEGPWKQIKEASSELEKILDDALSRKKTDTEKRAAYKENAQKVSDLLSSLKPLCESK